MCQILFYIPLRTWFGLPWDIPIHGYGFMLFLAFLCGLLVGLRLAKAHGVPADVVQDLAIWMFVPGILGARALFVITELSFFLANPLRIFAVWDGGLVFYGSAIGGLAGFVAAYFFLLRPKGISLWKMFDIAAPSVAIGLCLGRIGCLLNGCCFGHVAVADFPATTMPISVAKPPSASFPLPAEPRRHVVRRGLQTAAGFLVKDGDDFIVVTHIEPGSAADQAGLKVGDIITNMNGKAMVNSGVFEEQLTKKLERGHNTLQMKIQRGTATTTMAFTPLTIGLHPTQLYETISTGLLCFLLLSYFPFRRREGEVMGLLMIGYAAHRFLNEMVRNDTPPVALGLTLSQNISIAMVFAGIVIIWWVNRQPPARTIQPAPANTDAAVDDSEPQPETALHD